jgi:uncharacterized membrane protein YidH (DUF202 family)
MHKNLGLESLKRSFRIIGRLAFFVAVMIVIDAIGLSILLYFQGTLEYFAFFQFLILLMLFEGSLITAIGGFLFFTPSGRKVAKQGRASPAVTLMVAGVLTIFVGFLTSAVTNI